MRITRRAIRCSVLGILQPTPARVRMDPGGRFESGGNHTLFVRAESACHKRSGTIKPAFAAERYI